MDLQLIASLLQQQAATSRPAQQSASLSVLTSLLPPGARQASPAQQLLTSLLQPQQTHSLQDQWLTRALQEAALQQQLQRAEQKSKQEDFVKALLRLVQLQPQQQQPVSLSTATPTIISSTSSIITAPTLPIETATSTATNKLPHKAAVSLQKPKITPKPCVAVTFRERLQQIKVYRKEHGHCRVPVSNSGPYRQLGSWVQRIRRAYKQLSKECSEMRSLSMDEDALSPYKLTLERVKRLEQAGFEWKVLPEQTPWQQRYQQLQEFYAENGHSNVPRGYPTNRQLAEWVHTQRILYKKESKIMQGERITQLNQLNFQWRNNNNNSTDGKKPPAERQYVSWDVRFQQLVEFQEQFGHLHVSRKGEYEMLARWIHSNRSQYRRKAKVLVQGDRIQKMEAIGFVWDITRASNKTIATDASVSSSSTQENDSGGESNDEMEE